MSGHLTLKVLRLRGAGVALARRAALALLAAGLALAAAADAAAPLRARRGALAGHLTCSW